MKKRIYLDNNATTPIDPRVLDAIIKDLKESIGNPSSIHHYGQEAKNKLTKLRQTIAAYLKVKPHEVIFTSGGTEGANFVIRGLSPPSSKGHIITSNIEHSCVYGTIKEIEKQGAQCTFLAPGQWGAVDPDTIRQSLKSNTTMIAIMAVNNETGVKTDIASIAAIAKEAGVPLFVDGVAWLGKEKFEIPEGVSAMCFSGHKFHAPKGIGFVYLKNSLKIVPLLYGGDQEYGKRGGTENMPGIAGVAEAVRLLESELPSATDRMRELRDYMEMQLMGLLDGVRVNGAGPRVANTSNLLFEGVEGETLLASLDMAGVAVSHGSACASGALKPSRILLNMGLTSEEAASSIRISLSRFTTREEIEESIDIIKKVVNRLRRG